MVDKFKKLPARFYKKASGTEPVREWLQEFSKQDKVSIGEAIQMVEFGWPIGMPVCRSLRGYNPLWEVRANISNGIARVIFYVKNNEMILLHGFVKKTQKTPVKDLDLAMQRKKEHDKKNQQNY